MKVFAAADILLPREGTDMGLWPALACDQFTSQPEYWQKADALVGAAPSALRITLPEVYLEQPGVEARIAAIHDTMAAYEKEVLTQSLHGFVYVERATQSGVRGGLVGAVDLEAYSYEKGASPLVRPSENTVVERIPPRLAVRRGAPLEAPHILMLLDDAERAVIEPLAAKKEALQKLYDTPLMLGGGRVAGWAVTESGDIAAVEAAVEAMGAQRMFDEKYPMAAGKAPLALAVGDGNHSLATAKAYWEEIKALLPAAQRETHPARRCLVELVNIHSPALLVEPIHRAVFGVHGAALADAFTAWLTAQGAALDVRGADANNIQTFIFVDAAPQGGDLRVEAADMPHPLAVGTLELFLAEFCAKNKAARVDYIHGEASVRELARGGAAGVLLPEFKKDDLFKGVVLGGVLPKKTFSMGHAEEKRYYLECRKIAPETL